MFYYERFANHQNSEKLGNKLRPIMVHKITMLHELKNYPISELKFLEDAVKEVVKCRTVLKWSYVYGYYMDKNTKKSEREQFDFW